MDIRKFKLIFFVPVSHAEIVKSAVFTSGAGSLGNYSECSFETQGIGQFKPNDQAKPYIGSENLVQKVTEMRIEILCTDQNIKQAVKNLKESHPYEEPAYEIYSLCRLDI